MQLLLLDESIYLRMQIVFKLYFLRTDGKRVMWLLKRQSKSLDFNECRWDVNTWRDNYNVGRYLAVVYLQVRSN